MPNQYQVPPQEIVDTVHNLIIGLSESRELILKFTECPINPFGFIGQFINLDVDLFEFMDSVENSFGVRIEDADLVGISLEGLYKLIEHGMQAKTEGVSAQIVPPELPDDFWDGSGEAARLALLFGTEPDPNI